MSRAHCHNCGSEVVVIVDLGPVLERIDQLGEQVMTAIDDLQAVNADLATAVTNLATAVADLATDVNRIDTDFTALEAAVGNAGNVDPAIAAEVAKMRSTIDAANATVQAVNDAKAAIDATDVPPVVA